VGEGVWVGESLDLRLEKRWSMQVARAMRKLAMQGLHRWR